MTTADLPPNDAPSGFDYDGPPNPGDLLILISPDGHYCYRIVDGTESDVPPAGWTLGGRLDDEARAHYLPDLSITWLPDPTIPSETVVVDSPIVGPEPAGDGELVPVPRTLLTDLLWLIGASNTNAPADATSAGCFARIENDVRQALA